MSRRSVTVAVIALTCWTAAPLLAAPWLDPSLQVGEGLLLWLDASRQNAARTALWQPALNEGDPVAVVYDSVDRRRWAAQPRRQSQPTFHMAGSAATLRFDGEQDFLYVPGAGKDPEALTIFVLAAPRSNTGGFRALLSGGDGVTNDYVSGVNIDLGAHPTARLELINAEGAGFGGVRNLMSRPLDFERFAVFCVRVSPSEAVSLRIDGEDHGHRSREAESLKVRQWLLGARFFNNAGPTPHAQGFFDGDIAEVIVYGRVLADQEIKEVERYLKLKRDALESAFAAHRRGRVIQPVADAPPVQMLVPGFEVYELPIELTNINNLRYRPDGKLYALAYNGNVWLLSDTTGDGLEDHAELFWENDGSIVSPIGMAVTPPGYGHGEGVVFASKHEIALVVDTTGDDRADRKITVAEGWRPTIHQVDALGVAIDPEGYIYFGLGTTNFAEPYLIDRQTGQAGYRLESERGTIQKVWPDFSKREAVATGIRFSVGLALNRHGDLFATDQEGATWVPNGNPFDELLHIQPGRHYGFPPRHPKHLPDVIDEPSTFDYAPQHQAACGLTFNESVVEGGRVFGPDWWADDAIVTGQSRGKIYRTKLVKTPAGYAAQNQIIATLGMLTVDAAPTPAGGLVIACHSGPPDWGTGPQGEGKLYKVIYVDRQHPQPVLTWAAGEREVRIAFDRPLRDADLVGLSEGVTIEYGPYVRAGDRFETMWPPYAIVGQQRSTPRFDLNVHSVQVTPDRRTLVLATDPHPYAAHYAVTLPRGTGSPQTENHGPDGHAAVIPQHATIDLDYTLNGVQATWTDSEGHVEWRGWLPHIDLAVSRELTRHSAEHETLWSLIEQPGKMTLRAQLDLKDMLRPAVQEGSSLDYAYPPEKVTLSFEGSEASSSWRVATGDGQSAREESASGGTTVEFPYPSGLEQLHPIELVIATTAGHVGPRVSYFTHEDARRRPLQLARTFLPWADREAEAPALAERTIPEIEGGHWVRGREIFFGEQAMCSRCHIVDGRGGRIGPDLSNLIHRDYAAVLRDIQDPSATLNPDHITYQVQLTDGRTLIGAMRSEPDGRIVIGDATGHESTFDAEAIASSQALPISIMPANLHLAISETELRDLMTFLMTRPLEPAPLERTDAPPPRTRAEVEAVRAASPSESEPGSRSDPAKPLHILLVAGDKTHGPGEHDYPLWQKRWATLLGMADGVAIDTAYPWPTAAQFRQADVILIYQHGEWNEQRARDVDAFLARGGGLVYLHFAVDGRPDPDGLAQRIGLAWKGGGSKFRHGPLELKFTDHPITAGFESPTRFVDESYWNLVGEGEDITVLATGVEDGSPQPLIWTREVDKGRIFVSILGHYTWTFDDPLFRILVLRGAAWAAGAPTDRLLDLATAGARIAD